jgi:hypothetical protein
MVLIPRTGSHPGHRAEKFVVERVPRSLILAQAGEFILNALSRRVSGG